MLNVPLPITIQCCQDALSLDLTLLCDVELVLPQILGAQLGRIDLWCVHAGKYSLLQHDKFCENPLKVDLDGSLWDLCARKKGGCLSKEESMKESIHFPDAYITLDYPSKIQDKREPFLSKWCWKPKQAAHKAKAIGRKLEVWAIKVRMNPKDY